MKTQIRNQYIVYIGKNPAMWSLSAGRKLCIEAFLNGSTLEWKDRKKYNWTVHNVIVDICFY